LDQRVKVRLDLVQKVSGRGVRQGCCLSPIGWKWSAAQSQEGQKHLTNRKKKES